MKDLLAPKTTTMQIKHRFVKTEQEESSSNKHARMDVT